MKKISIGMVIGISLFFLLGATSYTYLKIYSDGTATQSVNFLSQVQLYSQAIATENYVIDHAPASAWGSITGTLSNQTDLKNALDAKGNLSGGNVWLGNQEFSSSIKTDSDILMSAIATPDSSTVSSGKIRFYANSVDSKLHYQTTGTDSAVGSGTGGVSSVTANSPIASSSSTGDITLSHSASGVTAGSYVYNTVNTTGHITSGTNTIPVSVSISNSSTNDLLNLLSTVTGGYTRIKYTATGRTWTAGVGNGDETIYGVANKFYIYDSTATAMRMVIDTSGNVGIGKVSPSYKMDVSGDVNVDSGYHYKVNGTNLSASNVGAVATSGNETVAGIKTFSNSPIVPTPTTDYQASTKAYVDSHTVDSMAKTFTYTSHGFTVSDVNKPISINPSGVPVLSSCASANAEFIGILSAVPTTSTYTVTTGKYTWTSHGFTVGSTLFLSSTAGTLTSTDSFTTGQIRKPIATVVDANTINIQPYLGIVIPSDSGSSSTGSGMWQLVERWEPSVNTASHTFSGLDGDNDRQYQIRSKIVVSASGAGNIVASFNSDTTPANYPYQDFAGSNTSASAGRGNDLPGIDITNVESSSTSIIHSIVEINAKSGTYRTALSTNMRNSGSLVYAYENLSQMWLNTTNNITSITLSQLNASNYFASGTCIELYKLSAGNGGTSGVASNGGTVSITSDYSMSVSEVGKKFTYTSSTTASRTFYMCSAPLNNSARTWIINNSSYDITVSGIRNSSSSSGTLTLGAGSTFLIESSGYDWFVRMHRWEALSTSTLSLMFNGLNGDVDIRYKLIARIKSVSGNDNLYLTFNGDSSTNYKHSILFNSSSNIIGTYFTGESSITINGTKTSNTTVFFAKSDIYAKSLTERLVFNTTSANDTSAYMGNTANYWTNTSDNITYMTLTSPLSIAVGSYIELWKTGDQP